jgi:hypothetical protein
MNEGPISDVPVGASKDAWKKIADWLMDLGIDLSAPKIAHLVGSIAIKLALVAVAGIAALSPLCVTQIRDYDLVVLRKWGKRVEGEIPPGLKWYWPVINTVHRYDIRPRAIQIDSKGETNLSGIGTQSREGWPVGVITDITYTLDRDKWQAIDDNFGSDDTEETRRQIENRIKIEVRYAIQNLMPQYDLEYLLDHRSELLQNAYVELGLSNDEVPGTQQTTAPDGKQEPFAVRLLKPLPIQRLSEVGVLIRSLAVQFNTPSDYDALQKKSATDRTAAKLARERADQLKQEQKVAEEEAKVRKIEAVGKAESELAVLRAKEQVSSMISFLEKWNGKLPEVVTSSPVAESIVNELVSSRALDRVSQNKAPQADQKEAK